VFVVMGLLVFSHITNILGTHDVVGAFVFGLILPNGKFADMVVSMTDDFGCGFLAPIYFCGNRFKLWVWGIFNHPNWPFTLIIILLLCVLKILSTLIATFLFGMHSQDGFVVGLLLNTKGVVALKMLNFAWDRLVPV
jgi:Kef-type K+ transport system membrane component KefB